jgi:hypothetical protein
MCSRQLVLFGASCSIMFVPILYICNASLWSAPCVCQCLLAFQSRAVCVCVRMSVCVPGRACMLVCVCVWMHVSVCERLHVSVCIMCARMLLVLKFAYLYMPCFHFLQILTTVIYIMFVDVVSVDEPWRKFLQNNDFIVFHVVIQHSCMYLTVVGVWSLVYAFFSYYMLVLNSLLLQVVSYSQMFGSWTVCCILHRYCSNIECLTLIWLHSLLTHENCIGG